MDLDRAMFDNRLHRIEKMLDKVLGALNRLNRKESFIMAAIDDVLTEVTAQTDIVTSVKTLVDGLHQQLSEALANGYTAKAQAILDKLKENDAALNAVLANTPSA